MLFAFFVRCRRSAMPWLVFAPVLFLSAALTLAGQVELPQGPSEPWDQRYTKQKLSDGGDLVTVPLPLTAAQIEPGLPPPGLGG